MKRLLLLSLLLLWQVVLADEGGDEHHNDDGEEVEEATSILFPWFCNILGVVCFYLLSRYLHMFPYTAVMFILGTCMGVGFSRLDGSSQLHESLAIWEGINGELLLLIFLPGLLFKDAFCSNVHLMSLAFNQCLIMAFPMVLAGVSLTALVAFYIFPYGWSFSLAMTIGSILSATDPVAVSSLLEEVGAPPRLKVHVSGESLFNDGSAMVFYVVFSSIALYEMGIGGSDVDFGEGVKIFCQMAFGGFGLGLLFGLALCLILYLLDRRLNAEENVVQIVATISMAYITFYVADPVCHTSGVIAVVFCGFVTKAFGQDMINDLHMMNSFWTLVEHILNTVLFALGGLVWGTVISNTNEREGHWTGRDWGYLFVLYILLTAIRFFLFASFYPIISRIGLKSSWQEMVFESYGGLRGAVGIALAIMLDYEVFSNTNDPVYLSWSTKVFGMVGGIAFLTLVINGTFAGPLLKKLGLSEDTALRHRIVSKYEKAYNEELLVDYVHLLMDPVYQSTDFAIVQKHILVFENVTAAQFREAVATNKARTPAVAYREPDLTNVYKLLEGTDEEAGDTGKGEMEVMEVTNDGEVVPAVTSEDSETDDDEGDDAVQETAKEETTKEDVAVDQSNEAKSSMVSTPEEEADLLVELRKIFVDLLRSSYHKLIEMGELDGREGFATYALLEGLDFTTDSVEKGEPVVDWEMTANIIGAWTAPVDRYVSKMIKNIAACNCRASKRKAKKTFHDMRRLNPEHERAIGVVRMTIGLIRAHEMANKLFKKEMAIMNCPTTEAMVLEESQKQMALAKEVLDSQENKDVIVSYIACSILINKAARYIERLTHNGLLKEGEAGEFMEELQEALLKLQACPEGEHEP